MESAPEKPAAILAKRADPRRFGVPRLGRAGLVLAWAAAFVAPPLAAQIVGQRPDIPAGLHPKRLSVREAVFSFVLEKAESVYRKDPDSKWFVVASTEGGARHEWRIGGRELPLPEGLPKPETVVERRLKFLPHEGKLFVRIEAAARPKDAAPGGEERRFSGTYELVPVEGSWQGYEAGGVLKAKLAAADHERYRAEVLRVFFGDEVLAGHASGFGRELVGVLERKLADPGPAPPEEVEAVRRIVAAAKERPESVAVSVTPSFEAAPETFVLEGDELRTATARQTTTLRFNASLPAPPDRP